MKIHEFQGKELFRKYGIPVPEGRVARTADEAGAAAAKLGGRCVVKAQIHAGGRGKGTLLELPEIHGVKLVDSAEEARAHAEALLGNNLQTHQTGPEGQQVKQVLVEAPSSIKKELYAGMVMDRDNSRIAFLASTEGGMDIEKVAAETPEKLLKIGVDPATGFSGFHGRRIASGLGLSGSLAKQAGKIFGALYRMFVETDASLVEINPLVITADDELVALDAKVNFDDNGMFRHPDIEELRDTAEEDPKEVRANEAGLSYVALDGNIGCLVNGAGLAMGTMDIIKTVGGEPANFLDVGGGATADQVSEAFSIILDDPNVKAILVNIFGGIAKCDVIAEGIVNAAKSIGLEVPLIVRLEGTNVEQGKAILAESGLAITPADNMLDAAQKAVQSTRGGAA